jgi:polyribonucleotide nucleotidyltransferase
MDLVSEVEEGCVYEGTVVEIKDFGAVIELLRNKEGLLHVSELTDTIDKHPGGNLGVVKEHLKVGDKIEVLCKCCSWSSRQMIFRFVLVSPILAILMNGRY